MSYKIVVLAKQVPDTRNVGKDAMKADGTVNRAALPAIFNPEDLNALEMALSIKDQLKDATVTVITMGPSRAADVIRESILGYHCFRLLCCLLDILRCSGCNIIKYKFFCNTSTKIYHNFLKHLALC